MINHKRLRRLYESACRDKQPQRFYEELQEGLRSGELDPNRDFSIGTLFEEFVENGRELLRSFDNSTRVNGVSLALLEDNGYVSTTAFSNITGQLVYSKVLEVWQKPEYVASSLVETITTQFDGEKIPGIGLLGDKATTVEEGKPYPVAGLNEEWIETPRTIKRGLIVGVTQEMVLFDRTGLLMKRAAEVADTVALSKEKRVLDTVLGNTTSYRRNGGAAVATYGDSSGSHNWDNLAASNTLVDWTDIENAELLFDAMTDPNTGEPIIVNVDTIIVPTALKKTAQRIVRATTTQFGDGASNTTATWGGNDGARPLNNGNGEYTIVSSPYVKDRTGSSSTWFIGQPRKAFAYMENWPVTVTQAPANSEVEFTHDIVTRFKVSERGAPAVLEPRYMVKCT